MQKEVCNMTQCLLIDGNSIMNRAFYALPPLTNAAGLYTNAVYGFTTMLLRMIEEERPTHMLVAFDAGKRTFRHEQYGEYKGGRAKTPPELSSQFPLLKQLLQAMNIHQFEIASYEADDIIGTLTKQASAQGMKTTVISGDKDMLQLATEQVKIALTRKGISEVEMFTPEVIAAKYMLTPTQITDLKGLMGDASDNIPGVPGVGEKTALKLLQAYGSVEGVLEHVDALKGKLQETIREHANNATLSKQIATIHCEVPIDFGWDDLRYTGMNNLAVKTIFQKLEFKSLLQRLDLDSSETEGTTYAEVRTVFVTESEIPLLIEALPQIQGLHVEVVGENPHQANIVGLSFYASRDVAYCLSLPALLSSAGQAVRDWLSNSEIKKILYDAHQAELALSWQGIALRGIAFDVILAAYLLKPTESSHLLSDLTSQYGVHPIPSDEAVFGKGAKFKLPEPIELAHHLGRKAKAIAQLSDKLRAALTEQQMESLYFTLELPLSMVLARMEMQGIRVQAEGLKQYGHTLQSSIDRLVENIYALAGTPFNLNSPKQLGDILFEKLGLPPIKKTKTGYSTDAEVLEKLAPYHEVVNELLKYRMLSKLHSTYVEGLQKEIRQETGKIHTYYRQTIAATGRLSSQFPNLQNIPIRSEEGRKLRQFFVPSERGSRIVSADYSQIELRVLAHISGDFRMKEAFLADLDIHTKTAMDVFGVSAAEVDANMRRQAKAVNFGIVYGISDYGLSQNLNISRKEAAQFIEQYFAVFAGVKNYMHEVVEQAKRDGFVTTMLNRRRYLPDLRASNFNLRSFAERMAMNTPIQGTAADIIKLAMVQMDERMRAQRVASRLLLQVHDELVFEVPVDELELMKKLIRETMEGALTLDVPLKVDIHDGENWYEAK
jgi:DNA polymerase-1